MLDFTDNITSNKNQNKRISKNFLRLQNKIWGYVVGHPTHLQIFKVSTWHL